MSLNDIRAMRLARQKPSGVVAVVVGKLPQKYRADPLYIEIPENSNPALVDLRPLVGVWVSVYAVAQDWKLFDATVEALHKAGAKLFGFVHNGKAYHLAAFEDPADKNKAAAVLWREWEALCN